MDNTHIGVDDRALSQIKYLVEHDADVNIQDKEGYTPLMYAAKHQSLPIIKYLVEHGADVNIRDNEGDNCLKPILMNSWSGEKQNQRDEIVKYLIDQGVNINNQNNLGSTPLMLVTLRGEQYLPIYFVEHGADVWLKDIRGNTAYDIAVKADFTVVDKLLKKKMDETKKI
jgi:ankyrin repeat protein